MHQKRSETVAGGKRRHELQAEERDVVQLLGTALQEARELKVALSCGVGHDDPDGIGRNYGAEACIVHLTPFTQVVLLVQLARRDQRLALLDSLGVTASLQRAQQIVKVCAHVALAVAASLPLLELILLVPQPFERCC